MHRSRLAGIMLVFMACGSVGESSVSGTTATVESADGSTMAPTTVVTTTSSQPSATAASCGDTFPVFYPGIDPPEGLPGPAPAGGTPTEGLLARHWLEDEYGLFIDARWPVSLEDIPEPDGDGNLVLQRTELDDGVSLLIDIAALIDVGGEQSCRLLRADIRSTDRMEPIEDFAASFGSDIRPIDELNEYLDPVVIPEPTEPVLPAIRVVEQFLESLGSSEFEVASSSLFNEGVAPEVEAKLGLTFENWDDSPALLEDYCETALCDAAYAVVGVERDGPRIAAVLVEFETEDGPVAWAVPIAHFEGVLTLGDLPPVGSGVERTRLGHRLFGSDVSFGVIWHDAVQRGFVDGDQWVRWWSARFADPDIMNRWGLVHHPGGLEVEDLALEFEVERIPDIKGRLSGSGVLDGREVGFISTDDALLELDIASLGVNQLMGPSNNEGFVGPADAAGQTLAVLMGVGDSLWVEFFDSSLTPISSTEDLRDGAHTSVALSRDGQTAAVVLERELHHATDVALIDVATGRQLEPWSYDGEGVLGDIEFDGRFIVVPVVSPPFVEGAAQDWLPRVFVVDTATDNVRTVFTSGRIDFD